MKNGIIKLTSFLDQELYKESVVSSIKDSDNISQKQKDHLISAFNRIDKIKHMLKDKGYVKYK